MMPANSSYDWAYYDGNGSTTFVDEEDILDLVVMYAFVFEGPNDPLNWAYDNPKNVFVARKVVR